jgi:hypothetical protein
MVLNRYSAGVILVFLGLALMLGCNPFLKPGPPTQSELKQKIVVLSFENTAGLGYPGIDTQVAKKIAALLAEEDHIAVMPAEEVDQYLKSQGIGNAVDATSARFIGRSLGLNAVVLGALSEVSQVHKRSGWRRWLRFITERQEYVTAVMVTKVVDVESGVLLSANTGRGEINTGNSSEDAWLGTDTESDGTKEMVQESLDEAIEDIAEQVSEALELQPWKGFVTRTDGEYAMLAAGEEVGIQVGHQFASYEIDKKITNAAGQTYVVPGKEKARLEVVEVQDRSTRLKVISGQVFTGEIIEFVD